MAGIAIAPGTAAAPGVITITYNTVAAAGGIPQLAGGKTLVLSPYINKAVLVAGMNGNIDWVCTSAGNTMAWCLRCRRVALAALMGTLLQTKYVPTQCK